MSLFVPADSSSNCFALLDDNDASAVDARSRLYSSHVGTLVCERADQLPAMLQQMQQALLQGQFAVSLFAYELGAAMHGIAPHETASDATAVPLAEVLLFQRCEKLSAEQVSAWLAQHASSSPAGIANVHPDISEAAFDSALARIHDYIAAGDTYQVNYTYRLRFDAYGSVHTLYRRLRERQPVPYGALIGLPDGRAVLSLSPELFVRHDDGLLTVRPMKGTAAASGNPQQDDVSAHALAADPKNRAENLMIVDLLRNDLGRIAEVGTVVVDKLFDVQRYSSVLQMTSTVHARLRDDIALPEIFDALYPCGSITGAPKHRTMQIIRELEANPRGIYTGAIGWFDPPQSTQTVGNFCLSVPIRTLQLQAQDELQIRRGEMGVGAGIVHDSVAKAEYEECRIKAGFLIDMPAEFELFETIYATRADGCRHIDRHLQRLRGSAEYFGFAFDDVKIRDALRDTCLQFSEATPYRLRLALQADGACIIQSAPLSAITSPVKVLLAETPTDAGDIFLRHKTTVRSGYDAAWRAAEQQGAFDQLFCNQDGQLTEGGRSTVFIKLDGHWYTPPLSVGVLPGVMRAVLLEDATLNAEEKILTLTDLRRAEEVVICNALRGALPATIVWNN
ncbi:MAG: aminodeoxychorismate synthase component I [Herminiimonas sp.]|uniref:aminodeoxychorismate synthase component I n=1 Tax=Herminiimonas sp. TaxID=1926289 RepID=UPI002728531D|nr:aminodeoxychorismate synthase component I [Herminiimonas sp.]MDO9421738.1 aminodeoxychorismate synthase component I [Herminiimonas sp.]MDO9421907.1 aminodeoxychorismate synthase component I [Herminiimonas sp.]